MPRPIHILHVLHAFSAGGLENGIVNLINRSPEYLVHELCFLSEGGDFLNRLSKKVVVHELHKREGKDLSVILRLRKLFLSTGFDIIHTRNWAAFDGVLAAASYPSVKVIHGEHGRDILDPQGHNRRRNFLRRFSCIWTKKFIAVSTDLYSWLWKEVGIPKQKLLLIPNGVDAERFYPNRKLELRRELGIADDEFIVGTIGRLDPVKNHEGLIRAVCRLSKDISKIRLVIVGEGPNRKTLEQAVLSSQAQTMPILTGYRPDVADFYGIFDLFVLNSFAEGMSNCLLEAMASGLPVVCTAIGGNLDLVHDGQNGFHVPVGNDNELAARIGSYIADTDLRQKHGCAAREFVKGRHSLQQMIDEYVRTYEVVAG